jgi:hypothetical protein
VRGHITESAEVPQHRRLLRIARRVGLEDKFAALDLFGDLYDEDDFFDPNENAFLEEEYEFSFKGSANFVEAVFQAVGFATRLARMCPDDESEAYYAVHVAPARRTSQ